MGSNKKYRMYMIISILGILFVIPSVFGAPVDSSSFKTDSATIDKYFSLVSNTDQCLVDCRTQYQVKNPGLSSMKVDASSFWYEFRDKGDLSIRNAEDVGSLDEFHIWRSDWKSVTRNSTNWSKECKSSFSLDSLNWTFDCSWVITNTSVTKNEVVESNVDALNVTLLPGESLNLTIIGRKSPYENVDNIPVLVSPDGVIAATKYAWWNTSWLQRVCLNNLTNQNSSNESRDLELFHINLSRVIGFNGCSNNTGVKCFDGRMVINDTDSNFREVLFNVSNYTRFRTAGASSGVAEEGATTLNLYFMMNTTQRYNASQYNVTPCFFFNNSNASISANHVGGIITELDSFESGIIVAGSSTPFSSVSIGSFTTNLTMGNGWTPDGNVSAMPSGAGTRDSLRDASGTSDTYVVYIYNSGGNWQRGVGFANADETSGAWGTCTNGRVGTDSGCAAANSTNGTGWHTIKMTAIGAGGGTNAYINGKVVQFSAAGIPSVMHIGEEAAAVSSNVLFDYVIGSLWDLNMYDYPSNFSLGVVENVTPSVSPTAGVECVVNSNLLNVSAIEQDSQVGELNVTSNRSNVTGIDVSFFYNAVNITPVSFNTPNDTATNNTLFRGFFNASIVSSNGTNVSVNWTVICYLNNGSIRSFNVTRGQVVGFAHRESENNWTNPLTEATLGNFSLNLSLFNTVVGVNASLFYNLSRMNASLNVTNSQAGGVNNTKFNASLFVPVIVVNNTANGFFWNITLLYRNGSTKRIVSSVQNQSLLWANFPDTLTAADILEGLSPMINASLNRTSTNADVALVVEYNGSNQSMTLVQNTSSVMRWQTNLSSFGLISAQLIQMNMTGYWNISFGGITVSRNISGKNHAVYQMNLTACNTTLTSTPSLNFTVQDELTSAPVNTSLAMNFITSAIIGSVNRTFGFSFGSNSSVVLCIYPNISMVSSGVVQYGSGVYSVRNRVFLPFNISNQVQNFLLLLLGTGNSTKINFQVVDEFTRGVTGAVIRISKFSIPSNSYTLVDTAITGVGGSTSSFLVPNVQHQFEIFDSGGTLRYNSSFLVTSTSYVFKIVLGTIINNQPFLNANTVNASIFCDNSSNMINFSWVDPTSTFSDFCLRVVNVTNGSYAIISSQCLANSAGNLSFGVVPVNNSLFGIGLGHQGGKTWILASCGLSNFGTEVIYGLEGVFWSAMLLLIVVGVGTWKVPVGLFMIIPWAIFVTVSGLLSIPQVSLIGFLGVLGMIALWGLNR